MHRLQQHILHRLITNPELRYAQLKPDDVEGNLFMYHLKQLMAEGLVEKTEAGRYRLSPKGEAFADHLSLKTFRPRIQPGIGILMAVTRPDGKWLLYRRRRLPVIDMVGFPIGKPRLGETVQESAQNELRDRTGLEAELTHRGDGYLTILRDGAVISQIMFHMFSGHDPKGELSAATSPGAGDVFWSDFSDLKTSELIPSVLELRGLLQSTPETERFFVERTYNL